MLKKIQLITLKSRKNMFKKKPKKRKIKVHTEVARKIKRRKFYMTICNHKELTFRAT